jgi:hypothetical protein
MIYKLNTKKMKKITLFLAVMAFAIMSYSQSNSEEVDLYQAAFGMEKKAMVENFVKVNDLQKDAFWQLYDEYEVKRKDNGKKRIKLLEQYAEQYYSMTDEQAETWAAEAIKLAAATDKLITTYYQKIKKATSPVVALQFYQIEAYILTGIRMEVLQGIPFVGEE